MSRLIILSILLASIFVSGCRKERGKREYEMQLLFNNGESYKDEGIVAEHKLKKQNGNAIYTTVFNDYFFLKVNGKLITSGLLLKNGKVGDIYFEGTYSRKGRAYIVEDGYCELIWRDVNGNPVNNEILIGKWTFRRK